MSIIIENLCLLFALHIVVVLVAMWKPKKRVERALKRQQEAERIRHQKNFQSFPATAGKRLVEPVASRARTQPGNEHGPHSRCSLELRRLQARRVLGLRSGGPERRTLTRVALVRPRGWLSWQVNAFRRRWSLRQSLRADATRLAWWSVGKVVRV
jgi:hypothetical protein